MPDGRARPGLNNFPIFFSQEFSDCAVASFAVRVATWLNSYDIVFVSSATDVMLDCVAVAEFSSTRVWSCCISVKIYALACAACTFAV